MTTVKKANANILKKVKFSASYRQLDHWARMGYFLPYVARTQGSGRKRDWKSLPPRRFVSVLITTRFFDRVPNDQKLLLVQILDRDGRLVVNTPDYEATFIIKERKQDADSSSTDRLSGDLAGGLVEDVSTGGAGDSSHSPEVLRLRPDGPVLQQ